MPLTSAKGIQMTEAAGIQQPSESTRYVAYNKFFKKEMPVVGSYYYDGKIRYVYEGGLEALAEKAAAASTKKYQTVSVFEGPTGRGKSTGGIHYLKAINPRWKIESGYVYGPPDLWRILKDDDAKLILIDEGSLLLNSKNAMRRDDVDIATMFDLMRVLGKTVVICAPKLESLNRHIRETHVDYLCKCPVYSPIPGVDPRGFLDIYVHVRRDWGKDYYKHVCTTIFPPLGRKLQEDYDKIKKKAIMRAMAKMEKLEE